MNERLFLLSMILLIGFSSSSARGEDCAACHAKQGVRETVPSVDPIVIKVDGAVRRITLEDAFRFHRHSCPGLSVAFKAVQYGFQILYEGEIPDRKDVAVISQTPQPGALDLLDLLMLGEGRSTKTRPPQGMASSRETIAFTFIRKSTRTAVDVRLKPEHYPEDFFAYKKKQVRNVLTPNEWQVLHGYMKGIILRVPGMSHESLFGNPKPYKIITWGVALPAHAPATKSLSRN